MSDKIDKVVEAGNALIDALRAESDFDSEDAYWELDAETLEWINEKDLINLTQLAHVLSRRCLDLESETWDSITNQSDQTTE